MSTIKVLNMSGKEVGTAELNDAVFGIEQIGRAHV